MMIMIVFVSFGLARRRSKPGVGLQVRKVVVLSMFVTNKHILLILMLHRSSSTKVRSGGLYLQRVGVVSKNNDFCVYVATYASTRSKGDDKNVVDMFDGDIHPRERMR